MHPSLLPGLGLNNANKTIGTTGTVTPNALNTQGSKTQNISKATAKTTELINNLIAKIASSKESGDKKTADAVQADVSNLNNAIALLQGQVQNLSSTEDEETVKKNRHKTINNKRKKFVMKKNSIKESTQITGFLKSILQKKYAKADKYLGNIVDNKIKGLISKSLT